MCNKIKQEYKLIEEQGPSHNMTFIIRLTLGHEVYQGQGTSMRKAQRAAAMLALANTKFPLPRPKEPKPVVPIPPTVELNGMALKRQEQVTYTVESQHKVR